MSAEGICLHCGLPLGRSSASDSFCCYGCEIAYDILGESGPEHTSRLSFYKLAAGAILGINVMMFSMPLYVESLAGYFHSGPGSVIYFDLLKWFLLALSTPVFILLGIPFIESAFNTVAERRALNADALIAVGITAAFLLSYYNTLFTSGAVYYETAVGILVIVTGGRYLEAKTRMKASEEVNTLRNSIPVVATRVMLDGLEIVTHVESLQIGDNIVVRPGEIIPVDAIILSGTANVGEALLTGESKPVSKNSGDELVAGSINFDGLLYAGVLRPLEESYVSRMKNLLDHAKLHKAHIQEVADRISAIAVPIVLVVAVGTLVYWSFAIDFRTGLFHFLSVLLIACPCALGIATPAALWVATSNASKHGILFHSLAALERLSTVTTVLFDKTGTLTEGKLSLVGMKVNRLALTHEFGGDEATFLTMLQRVEGFSNHPLAKAAVAALPENLSNLGEVSEFEEIPGAGIRATLRGKKFWIGSREFTGADHDFASTELVEEEHPLISSVWCSVMSEEIARDREAVCLMQFKDTLRPDASLVINELHKRGIATSILSGDNNEHAKMLGEELHTEAVGGLKPEDKVRLVGETPHSLFVGDGLNDAAAIATATVGVAIGTGADITRAEADVTLTTSDLLLIPKLLDASKRTMRVVRQNIAWAFIYNVVGVALAAMGYLTPIIAVMAMGLSSLAVGQNSLRLRNVFDQVTKEAKAHA